MEELYSLEKLAEAAGVSRRTIRYYTTEGLLPPPLSRGRYAAYTREHLVRLRLIARLRAAFLPLSAIRQQLQALAEEDIRGLLAQGEQGPAAAGAQEAPSTSAAEYVARLLERQRAPRSHPPAGRSAAPLSPAPPGPQAMPQSLSEAAGVYEEREDRLACLHLSEAMGPGLTPADPRSPYHAGALPSGPEAERGETWERVVLAPGVELHVRSPASPEARELVERVLTQARLPRTG